jgi:high-affinity nickel-transport protein
VHGLAGSAAIALVVLTIIRDPILAAAYLLLFGIGTIGGMMLITLLLTAPFVFTSVNLPRFNWQLAVASGLISFAFGLSSSTTSASPMAVWSPTIRMGNHTDR